MVQKFVSILKHFFGFQSAAMLNFFSFSNVPLVDHELFAKITRTEMKIVKLSDMLDTIYGVNREWDHSVGLLMPDINHHELNTNNEVFSKFVCDTFYEMFYIRI